MTSLETFGIMVLSSTCRKKGLVPKEIDTDKVTTLGDDAATVSTLKKREAKIGRGRKSL